MTAELQATLERELHDAEQLPEPRRAEAILTVQSHMIVALLDCQRKTADRVKTLLADNEQRKQRLEGAKILWRLLRYAVAFGGGAGVIQLLSH